MGKLLSEQIAAYEEMRRTLELDHMGKWVVVYDEELVGVYEDLQEAADVAVQRFGRGPYLIQEVGEGPMALPASLLYQPVYADSQS